MKSCWTAVKAGDQRLRLWAVRSRARQYSQAVRSRERSRESVVVPCHSNGEITLDVHQPLASSTHHETTPKILVYLPRGPLWSNEDQEAATTTTLAQHLPGHHLVRINYRLSQRHQYPTPVHDTVTGWDWIVQNLLPKRAISRPGRANHVGHIAVCGELVGGGLASMLALTECRIGEPSVIAAAVNNPLVDWVSLAESAQKTAEGRKPSVSPGNELLGLRQSLFSKPDRYFDPFASPLMFFRTPGIDVPPAPAEVSLDDMAQLSLHEREEHLKQYASISAKSDPKAEEALAYSPISATSKKASRRYPSAALNLRLPSFHASSGSLAPFSQQSEELVHLLRQSFIRQARQTTSGSSFGRKQLLDDKEDAFEDEDEKTLKAKQKVEAEEKVQLHQYRDSGSWDGNKTGRERVRQVAMWLNERMQ